MKIYIAGAIFGTGPDRNIKEFHRIAMAAQKQLCAETIIPHNILPEEHLGRLCPPGRRSDGVEHNEGCFLRTDIRELTTCDGIALVPGWQQSQGARNELSVANMIGLTVYYLDPAGLLRKVN